MYTWRLVLSRRVVRHHLRLSVARLEMRHFTMKPTDLLLSCSGGYGWLVGLHNPSCSKQYIKDWWTNSFNNCWPMVCEEPLVVCSFTTMISKNTGQYTWLGVWQWNFEWREIRIHFISSCIASKLVGLYDARGSTARHILHVYIASFG